MRVILHLETVKGDELLLGEYLGHAAFAVVQLHFELIVASGSGGESQYQMVGCWIAVDTVLLILLIL